MLKLVPPRPAGVTTSSIQLERQQRFALADLLRNTEAMLCCAQKGDWMAVEAMENMRKCDLTDFFSRNDKENSALLSEVISTLIALNDQIALLVQQAKVSANQERQGLLHGQRAASNYLQIQDGS